MRLSYCLTSAWRGFDPSLYKNITQLFFETSLVMSNRYISELKDRQAMLCSELDTFQQGEQRSLRLHTENIEVELASISSYCDSMESFLNSTDASIPEADLVNIKHQCSEYMQQLRHAEGEEIPSTRTVRFNADNAEALHTSIAAFGTVAVLGGSGSGGSTARGMNGGGTGAGTDRSTRGGRNGRRASEERRGAAAAAEPPRTRARWSTPNLGRLTLGEYLFDQSLIYILYNNEKSIVFVLMLI